MLSLNCWLHISVKLECQNMSMERDHFEKIGKISNNSCREFVFIQLHKIIGNLFPVNKNYY